MREVRNAPPPDGGRPPAPQELTHTRARRCSPLAGERSTGKHRIVKGDVVQGLPTVQPPTHWVGSKTVPGMTTTAFDFSMPVNMTVPELLANVHLVSFFGPGAVDPREVEATLAELETDGKQRIVSVAADFDEPFAEFGETAHQKQIVERLLERLDKLCAIWKPGV